MSNVVHDLSVLTNVPETYVEKLLQKTTYVICEQIKEDLIADEEVSEIDLYIGKLYIKYSGEEIRYKFIPSETLQSAVQSTVNNKLNLLENKLNEALVKKFVQLYKDLC